MIWSYWVEVERNLRDWCGDGTLGQCMGDEGRLVVESVNALCIGQPCDKSY